MPTWSLLGGLAVLSAVHEGKPALQAKYGVVGLVQDRVAQTAVRLLPPQQRGKWPKHTDYISWAFRAGQDGSEDQNPEQNLNVMLVRYTPSGNFLLTLHKDRGDVKLWDAARMRVGGLVEAGEHLCWMERHEEWLLATCSSCSVHPILKAGMSFAPFPTSPLLRLCAQQADRGRNRVIEAEATKPSCNNVYNKSEQSEGSVIQGPRTKDQGRSGKRGRVT